ATMEEGLSMLSRPEATVVTLEHTLASDESRGSGASIIGQIEDISDSIGNCYESSILQINQEGNNDDTIIEDLSVGRSNVGDPTDIFDSNQTSMRATPRAMPFTSMDEYEAQILSDLNARTPGPGMYYGTLFEKERKARFRIPESEILQLNQAYYTVICFMLDHETANVDYWNIKDQCFFYEGASSISNMSNNQYRDGYQGYIETSFIFYLLLGNEQGSSK
ncbi:hypothetical protein BGW38_006983, partial [Lunasporangiospora selenospora]